MSSEYINQYAEEWLQVLEMEDCPYKQGKESLRWTRIDGTWCYCCLGVGLDLLIQKHNDLFPDAKWIGDTFHHKMSEATQWMPDIGVHLYGLRSFSVVKELGYMNDREDLSFKEIAAKIRANPEHYFLPISEQEKF